MRTTLADVARLAGVSTMTVSRVINQTGNVSREKRDAVLKAIASLNYHPNSAARTLATNRSNTIGLLLTFIKNPIYGIYIEGITSQLKENGLDVILYYADSFASTLHGVNTLLSKQVDGIIMLPLEIPKESKKKTSMFTQTLQGIFDKNAKPLVIIGNTVIDFGNHIMEDYITGVEIAIQHLVSMGHRNIGYIQCPDDTYPWNERTLGYKKAMVNNGLTVNKDWQVIVPEHLDEIIQIVRNWMRLLIENDQPRPTAVYCANDLLALGTMHAMRHLGVNVPDDLSIIGHDGSIISEYAYPKMTTVAISAYDTGRSAAKLLVKMLKSGKVTRDRKIYMTTKLIEGETVKKLL